MKQTDSTYRLQISPKFNFNDLERILDYLDDLGITTIYSAPFFQSKEGSTHGYDVLDPFMINKEIGDITGFAAISERLNQKGMSWLQDIVPNHMAYDSKNPWLRDIFELGPASRFYNFFDIDWEFKGLYKVMAPFLGDTLDEVLRNKEMSIKIDNQGIFLKYYDNEYPVSRKTYELLLSKMKHEEIFNKISQFNQFDREWFEIKKEILDVLNQEPSQELNVHVLLEEINNSEKKIREILELQFFLPTHWQKTESEINYRRFFTINGLICLRMEEPEVFNTYHLFIKELCEKGLINGLRIDHIDGLFDPESYLINLRKLVGNDFYIIVEKILEVDEKLPSHWPAQGTSGYDFLAYLNHLFTKSSEAEDFSQAYEKIFPRIPNYEDLVYQKKLFILKERMGGELDNLWRYLKSNKLLEGLNPKEEIWKSALGAFLSAFPVYRVYPNKFPLNTKQLQIIETAFKKALEIEPERKSELEYLRSLYRGETGRDMEKALYFLQRCQQYSGPLAAKGVEDTSFYIYNRLIAHNEVGDSPEHFGISSDEFHQKMIKRKKNFPLSVNASSTHDTKRGEDSRMRLLVLSEIPEEWFSRVEEWQNLNRNVKQHNIPDNNEEYFIYQTIVGAMPLNEEDDFVSRTCAYLQKVLREAKVHSNWANPDEDYEKKVMRFVKDILNNPGFRSSLDPFVKKIAGYGVIKSLGQSLIKITAPGIPDIYQGTELWDLSYVDPDNRKPVDYGLRMNYLADFRGFSKTNIKKKLSSLKLNFKSGKIKMFLINKALIQRRKDKELYQKGEYLPLNIRGKASENFIAYARILGDEWRIVIVPIVVIPFFNHGNLKPEKALLKDLTLELPSNAPNEWDFVFTGDSIFAEDVIFICNALAEFPVVLIKNRKQIWT